MSAVRKTFDCLVQHRRALRGVVRWGAVILATACTDLTRPSTGTLVQPASQASLTLGDTTGLIAYWRLDEAAGATSFADSSGSGIAGSCTVSTCPALGVWGKAGTAAQFTRADAQTITFGTPAQLDFGTSSFSYGFWANVPEVPDSSVGSEIVWYKGGTNANDAGFALNISALGGGWFATISDGVTRPTVFSWVIHPNQWTHLMAVVDRTAGTLTLYQDGSAVGATALDSLGSVTNARAAVLSCGPYGYCFDGVLDDVRIYSRALTATDVQNLYQAFGKDYYASPTGNDLNPCTATAPCYTMRRVSQLMNPGDVAHFAAGNYTWSQDINQVDKSGTASAYITYISDVKWGAKVTGVGCWPIRNSGSHVQIINFDVTGPCAGGITTNGDSTRVIGNRVHDLPGVETVGAITQDCCGGNHTGNEIIGNVVDNIGPWGQVNQTHGIYLAGPGNVAMNNIVTRAAASCIHSYHRATRLIISNNTVANCGRYGIHVSADPSVTTNDSTTVDNNIVVNSGQFGIYESCFGLTGPNNRYYKNIVYNNRVNVSLCTSPPDSATTITLTPEQFNALFVNYTGDMSGNYHLQSAAVAIDSGTTRCAPGVSICVPAIDFDGFIRPYGLAYDIGAYEWHP